MVSWPFFSTVDVVFFQLHLTTSNIRSPSRPPSAAMGMNQEHAAAAAFHAAKMAQFSAMGHNLPPPPPSHLDLSKLASLPTLAAQIASAGGRHSPNDNEQPSAGCGGSADGTTTTSSRPNAEAAANNTIEPTNMAASLSQRLAAMQQQQQHERGADIRRGVDGEPMDLGGGTASGFDAAILHHHQQQQQHANAVGEHQQQQHHSHQQKSQQRGGDQSSGDEDNYSDDDNDQTS